MPLTAPRNTPRLGDSAVADLLSLPVKGGTKIFAGSLVCVENGYAVPGKTAIGLVAAGRAETTVDNSMGANGALAISVRRGPFLFDGVDLTDTSLMKTCYVVDDHTVAGNDGSGTRSPAGKLIAGGPDGVWVEIT